MLTKVVCIVIFLLITKIKMLLLINFNKPLQHRRNHKKYKKKILNVDEHKTYTVIFLETATHITHTFHQFITIPQFVVIVCQFVAFLFTSGIFTVNYKPFLRLAGDMR